VNISPEDFKNRLLAGESLPWGLVVADDFRLSPSDLKRLPGGLVITGSLDLCWCSSLTRLPPNLKVGGHLTLYYCTSLEGIPADIEVGGEILCSVSLIDKIPYEDLPLYLNLRFGNHINEYISNKLKINRFSVKK
jgi:hypothetical protein